MFLYYSHFLSAMCMQELLPLCCSTETLFRRITFSTWFQRELSRHRFCMINIWLYKVKCGSSFLFLPSVHVRGLHPELPVWTVMSSRMWVTSSNGLLCSDLQAAKVMRWLRCIRIHVRACTHRHTHTHTYTTLFWWSGSVILLHSLYLWRNYKSACSYTFNHYFIQFIY